MEAIQAVGPSVRINRDAGPDVDAGAGALGPIRVLKTGLVAGTLIKGPRHLNPAAPRTYTLMLQSRGTGSFAHLGHEIRLEEGDFTLCEGAAPFVYHALETGQLVQLRIPGNLMKDHLPSPEFFCGRHLSAAQGLTATVGKLALDLCAHAGGTLTAEFQSRVARHLLDLIATAYAMAFEAYSTTSSVVSGRHAKVRLYIEQHLRDPSLSPCAIATNLKLSSRYLRMIFASGEETVSAYILRRRLEECARQMADPRWRGHSISEIAFAWGFNSASHFTRSFRDRFGVSPRNYRRLHVDERVPALCA